jgi:hypothetical protein
MPRDADFTREFLKRHQDKLIFGSDCLRRWPRHGIAQVTTGGEPSAASASRETLALLQRSAVAVFRKLSSTTAVASIRR